MPRRPSIEIDLERDLFAAGQPAGADPLADMLAYKGDIDMPKSAFLGEWEQLVLLAILRQDGDARIPALRDHLSAVVGRSIARGALYNTLDRLEEKGYLAWDLTAPEPGRGGHPSRRFRVTPAGRAAVNASRRALQTLWAEVDEASR